jgi:signal transduction histidine kinase
VAPPSFLARCAAVLLLLATLAPTFFCAAASAAVHTVTDADRVDLTGALEVCEGAADLDVAAVVAGACRFEPATPKNLARGFSESISWLRLTLANSGGTPVERLLMVGHRRLERAAFFESDTQGGWRRSVSGLAVPLAERAYLSPEPILPLRLEPGESRTIYVRVASRTSINLTTMLWRERAYLDARGRSDFEQAAGIGGILVAAMFSLLMASAHFFSQWSNRANLYLASALVAKAAFNASIAGFFPLYALAPTQSYDLRVQAVSLALTSIFFALFVTHFVDARKNYRLFHWIFQALVVFVCAEAAWAILVAYGRAFQLMTITGFAVSICSVALLWRAWRDRLPAAGFLFAATAINMAVVLHRIVLAFAGGHYNDALLSAYSWAFMLTAPLLPLGIALHERTLHRALERARRENVARLEFLAQMSHELRTPLDTILGNAQLLSRPGTHPSLMAEGLGAIQDSGRRLLRMIDDILDHARGLAGKLAIRPAPVDWPTFLRGVAFNAKSVAARQGNTFGLRQDGAAVRTLRLDEGRLRQILDNLIVNAARHTRGGHIELSCRVIPEHGGYVLDLSVTDTGEGVAPEDQERIFLPFERGGAKSSRRGDKGLGMGLTISRQLAQMMGGRLTLHSEPGRGACFRFQVRTTAVEVLPRAAAISPAQAASGRKALLVDDEDDNRHVLAIFLRENGFDVLEAGSGRAAVALLEDAGDIDIVLTDQFMAGGDGWMVLQAARRLRPDIAVVSISAAPLERPAGIKAAFDASFMKPLDHAALLQGVADLLGLDLDAGQAPASAPPCAGERPQARPDAAAMDELRRMIGNGQVSEIMAWAEARKTIDPFCARFADEIGAAARRLDFETLNALADVRDPGAGLGM